MKRERWNVWLFKGFFRENKNWVPHAGIGTGNGKEARTRNEGAERYTCNNFPDCSKLSSRITRGKNLPRNHIFLAHYQPSLSSLDHRNARAMFREINLLVGRIIRRCWTSSRRMSKVSPKTSLLTFIHWKLSELLFLGDAWLRILLFASCSEVSAEENDFCIKALQKKENRSARETSRERRTNCIYFHHNSFRRNGFTNGANINSEFFGTLVKVRFLYARK